MGAIQWSGDDAPVERVGRQGQIDRARIVLEQSAAKRGAGIAFGVVAGSIFLVVGAGAGFGGPTWLFGFFGLALIVASVAALARGSDPRLIGIGPDGVWLPGMGRLPWDEIAEVRLEDLSGRPPGDDAAGYRRIAVVPRNQDLRPDPLTRLSWAFLRAYWSLARLGDPTEGAEGTRSAPFGLTETDTSRSDFEAALAVMARYVEVVDQRARSSPRAPGPAWPAKAPSTIANLAEIDAHLAPAAPADPEREDAAGGGGAPTPG